MLNSFGQYQKVLVLGGKSDLALATLALLPLSIDAEILICGKNLNSFDYPQWMQSYQVSEYELNFKNTTDSESTVRDIFRKGDVDLVIIAYAILGKEESQLNPEQYAEILFTNFYSQALLLNQVNHNLRLQKHGQILVFSSVAGMRPRRKNFVYGVTKSGIDFIAQGLQKDNIGEGVEITIVRPGFVYTKMTKGATPAPFAISLEKAARISAKGLIRNKNVVYAPSILKFVMNILKLFPEKVFRLIDK
jgi:decaprenylphospho-beta-D-erythro-pentofuranosid-2-ulose 2-reductase